jgi:uroporphyrinogen decarboxylase
MTRRERVLAALRHEQPDQTPYHVGFTRRAYEKMVAYTGDPAFASKLGNCLLGLGTSRPDSWREVETDVWEDEFGVRWDRSVDKDIGVVCNQVITPENLEEHVWPDPDDPGRYERYQEAMAANPDLFAVAGLGFSLFERAWTLTGMENLLVAMVQDKPFVNRLLDRILNFNLRVIENACAHPIDAMQFGDDWGHQRGLITGPALWREFIKPRVWRMYQAVRSRNKRVFIHSCGKVAELFPDLIECGLDCFNPFQPEVIDVYDAKRRFGDRLSFYGGISTQRLLPFGSVAEVRAEVRRLLDEVGRNGGYIAAPAHAIPGDARPENIAAMIETLQDQ